MLKPRHGVSPFLRQLHGFMSRSRRRQFYGVVGLMLLGSIAELMAIGAVVPFLAFLAGQVEGRDFLGLTLNLQTTTALFMVAALAAGGIRLALTWCSQRFVLGLAHDLAVEIQRRTLFQPYAFHIARNSSEAIATLQKVQDFASGVLLQVMQALTAGVLSLFIVAALMWVDAGAASIAAVAVIVLYGLVSLVTRKRLRQNSELLGSAYAERVQTIQESLGGIRDVIVDHSQAAHLDQFRRIDGRFAIARANTAFIASAPRFVIEAVGMVVIAALALYLSGREGSLAAAIPIIGALALGAQRLLPMIQQLYQAWTSLTGNRSIMSQVASALELPMDENVEALPTPLPLQSEIRLEHVSFAYPERAVAAVKDISLTIPKGSRVALIGKTGSGKSTLADLLMGLLEPDHGSISIDGVPLTGAKRAAWRQTVAHVPQSIFLADTSIARNISLSSPGQEIDLGRLVEAAKLAQLDSFIETLPDGYETRVGERGVRLSGGQRQRLGIARAIYKDASVLVLDEATNALDPETEAAVMGALAQLGREGRTIIVIAHRSSTIEASDLLIRLVDGRVESAGGVAAPFGPATRAKAS